MAQMVEQRLCNLMVPGSNPTTFGSYEIVFLSATHNAIFAKRGYHLHFSCCCLRRFDQASDPEQNPP